MQIFSHDDENGKCATVVVEDGAAKWNKIDCDATSSAVVCENFLSGYIIGNTNYLHQRLSSLFQYFLGCYVHPEEEFNVLPTIPIEADDKYPFSTCNDGCLELELFYFILRDVPDDDLSCHCVEIPIGGNEV